MTTGVVVLVAAVLVATVFAVWRYRTDGRFRGAPGATAGPPPVPVSTDGPAVPEPVDDRTVLGPDDLGAGLGERATVVQFSTSFCAPCRATRTLATDVAATVPGVAYVDVDAESNLALVRRLDVLRTPTVLVLDAGGAVVTRASGAPRRADLLAALGRAIDPS